MSRAARRSVLSAVLSAAVVLAGVLVPAPAGAATPRTAPAASVDIAGVGVVGRFDTAVITVNERCRGGAAFAELVVDVSQGVVSGTRAGTFGGRCDGAWHRVSVEVFSDTGEPIAAGAVHVFARLTVLAAGSMDPLPQATDSAQVTLLPRVSVRLGVGARVGRFDTAVVPMGYRCQRPWLVAELDVEVDQNPSGGSAFRTSGLRCDGRWHHLVVEVAADTATPFTAGFAEITVSLGVQDPVDFDPVASATVRARTWLAPAARIVIDSARRAASGAVLVAVSARCQRPWVVAEYVVAVSQPGRADGLTARQAGLACDTKWHRLVVSVAGARPFAAGSADVSASLDVLDPVDFDPVDQSTDQRTVTLA